MINEECRMMKNIVVILAGGIGSRLGLDKPKQFMKVAGKTVLEHTVEIFQKNKLIDEIAIVMNSSYVHDTETLVLKNHWDKVKKILVGGEERYMSSLVAINAYRKYTDSLNLIFHDAVRPLVSKRIIENVIDMLNQYDAVDVAIPSADTIIKIKDDYSIDYIPERKSLLRGQTPQAFKYNVIAMAYEKALEDSDLQATDDCGIVKKYLPDVKIAVINGEEQNMKLTYPEDIYVLDKLFQVKSEIINERINLDDLYDKVLVVFGGNSGIGLDMIKIAENHGAHCYAFSRSLNATDICTFGGVERALKEVYSICGRIDYVVDTAAILNKEPFMHLDYKMISKIISTNYIGMVNVTKAAYSYIKESSGQILHFTSSSYTRGRANYALYSSTKAATVNFVQAIAEEWDEEGIRINCINPQRTKTPMRIENFGNEPDNTLLKSEDVAEESLKVLLSEFSGKVVDIKL